MEKHLSQSSPGSPGVLREAAANTPGRPAKSRKLQDEFAEAQLPREKFLAGKDLSDHELLAIIIGKGMQGHNVLEISKAIMKDYETLAMLTKAGVDDLRRYAGIGKVKAIEISAVLEIARRVSASQHDADKFSLLTHPEIVAVKVGGYKLSDDTESFFVLPLDKKCRLCGPMTEISRGTLDSSIAHPREVFKVALRWSAASVIVAHNHPSGDPAPSREDMDVTRKLIESGRVLSIPLLDHIIVGDANLFPPGFHSVRRSGTIPFE